MFFVTTDLCFDNIAFLVRKVLSYTPNANGSYGRQAGRLTDELQMDFEIFKIWVKLFVF